MSLVPYLVKKYLRFDKSQPFITVSAILAFLGVSIGLMVLIIAMAIMNGTSKEFKEKISTMSYPITILPAMADATVNKYALDALKAKFPGFTYSPYINSQVIVKKGKKLEGAMIFGVDFPSEAKINKIVAKALNDTNISDKFEILTGDGIGASYALDKGEKVTLIFTESQPGGFSLIPVMKRFTYKGDFKSGMQAYDNAYIYTSIKALSKVLKMDKGDYDGIHVSTENPLEDIKKIRKFIPPYYAAVGWGSKMAIFFPRWRWKREHFLSS